MNFITFNWMLPTVNESTTNTQEPKQEEKLQGVLYWQEKSLQAQQRKQRGPFANGILGFLFPNLFGSNELHEQIKNLGK